MSDNDDLFAESDDDDDKKKKSAPNNKLKQKKAAPKKAEKKKKSGDDDDDDEGLFDSSDDDDDGKKAAKKKSPSKPAKKGGGGAGMSKRERLEALANKRQKKDGSDAPSKPAKSARSKDAKDGANKEKKEGYESGDSYDSADFQRTQEDDDFLDTTGEDADAVNELYAEQHFDDERPAEERLSKKAKKRKIRYDDDGKPMGNDNLGNTELEPDNPIMAAVHRMKKKKREKKSLTEIEEEVKEFLTKMEHAAEDDEAAIAERKPAVKKLAMLNEVVDMLTREDMRRTLLDLDLLTICRRWIQPLPNGTLGNVTVRQRLLDVIGNMTGETGISPADLKRSEFGKTIMVLFKHRSETPDMKRQLKTLIEQWSRPIFQKSGNMRDLERVHASRGEGSLAAVARQHQMIARIDENNKKSIKEGNNRQDLDSLITSGKKGGTESGITRVRVPYSKGFSFSVRPQDRMGEVEPQSQQQQKGRSGDIRGKLNKRMIEKGRGVSKNQRSANVSTQGRPTK